MSNAELAAAVRKYAAVEDSYVNALREKGLKFAERGAGEERIAQLREELASRGAQFKNAGASIVVGWQSKACVECTGSNGSETFSTTFKCHRDCYFCFNHNQADYDTFFKEGCPWEEGLERSARENQGKLACVGLTGGEPLLVLDDSIRFLEQAREAFPGAHLRMYTSGDLLTEKAAIRLRDAGLEEIRFSVKDFDPEDLQERVLAAMELACRYIPDVMVEMPIIPGTGERMKWLFKRFDEIGIKGINMLEFCFPFCNWEEFDKRGLLIRNPPFPIMYDYGYSGGLPIAGSEELILELMLHGMDEGVSFGMHYCSLENKHRSEMRQMNERGARIHPCFEFDSGDFFLKTAKVFGEDRDQVV
ncbi:MAG: radical SAM protein, partial [Eggerthellaceae bacterium]|nr:radical SAM protein [Eggerthellaceae bacterium]